MQTSIHNDLSCRALTLAVVTVELRVEQLRSEWRAMTPREQNKMPGLEQQIQDEREALRWLKSERERAYRDASVPA